MKYFLGVLFPIVFVQSGLKTFVAAISFKGYKSMKKDLRKGIGALSFYIVL